MEIQMLFIVAMFAGAAILWIAISRESRGVAAFGLMVVAVVCVAVGATNAVASTTVNDRRDVITCNANTTEDFRFVRSFVRLADGRARIVVACPHGTDRDVITCPTSTTEDASFVRSFDRLNDGRARVVVACA